MRARNVCRRIAQSFCNRILSQKDQINTSVPLLAVGDTMTPTQADARRASIIAVVSVTCAICALYLPLFLG
jgi:hypothetical protein